MVGVAGENEPRLDGGKEKPCRRFGQTIPLRSKAVRLVLALGSVGFFAVLIKLLKTCLAIFPKKHLHLRRFSQQR
jgi:hypothetical protein